MVEETIPIRFRERPSETVGNQATRVEWAVGSHREIVDAFFRAGSAYERDRGEITGEFDTIGSVISRLLEDARSLSMGGMEEEAQIFIAEARSRQRNFVVAAELLTSGTRSLLDVDWQTMGYRPDFSVLDRFRNRVLGRGLVIGDQTISEKELKKISADPVAQVRFYLTVVAARDGELIGLNPRELVEGLRRSTPLPQLRMWSAERLHPLPEGIEWPDPPRIMSEIKITQEDLK